MKKLSLSKIIVALLICNVYVFACGVTGMVSSVPIAELDASDTSQSDAPSAEHPTDDTQSDTETNGQGTVDFIIIPDETVESDDSAEALELLNLRQPQMADKVISTTCASVNENVEPDIEIDVEIPEETSSEEIIIDMPQEIVTTTPATTTPATTTPATTTPATTTPATTTPATTTPVTTTPAATTPATTTPATTTPDPYSGGIPVEDTSANSASAEETTTTEPQQPEEPDTNNADAANEILTVKDNGTVVSGNAVDIIARITQNEVGYSFAPEAIKAQAVAAYTYVQFCNKYGTYPNVLLSSEVNDSVRVLVASVIGECVYYDGSIIQAVYSASSAGYTASSLNVWGNQYPYLVSRYCELDALYDPNYGRTATYTSADIKERVYNKTGIVLEGDPSAWLAIEEYVDGSYVGQMNVGGYHSYTDSYGDSVKITGKVFREKIMSYDLRSSAFDIAYDAASDSFTFTTYGYGHGVGLSQNGAHALATYWGYDYKQILQFYYTDCEVY